MKSESRNITAPMLRLLREDLVGWRFSSPSSGTFTVAKRDATTVDSPLYWIVYDDTSVYGSVEPLPYGKHFDEELGEFGPVPIYTGGPEGWFPVCALCKQKLSFDAAAPPQTEALEALPMRCGCIVASCLSCAATYNLSVEDGTCSISWHLKIDKVHNVRCHPIQPRMITRAGATPTGIFKETLIGESISCTLDHVELPISIEQAIGGLKKAHDYSDPYCVALGKALCKDCGQERGSMWSLLNCEPRPNWRITMDEKYRADNDRARNEDASWRCISGDPEDLIARPDGYGGIAIRILGKARMKALALLDKK